MTYEKSILELRAQGKTYSEIQSILGCSKSTIAYYVGEGQKQKVIDRTNRKRTELKRKIWAIKEESGCVDCGEKYPHWMLDFDHKPGKEKIDSPTRILHVYSWHKAVIEIKKCDIVCANCHRIRTYTRNQSGYKKI